MDITERLAANIADYERMNQTGSLLSDAKQEIERLRLVLGSIAESAVMNEGVRMASPSYGDDDCFDIPMLLGDMRKAVALTNHDCQNGDRIAYAGPHAEMAKSTSTV